MEYLTFFNGHKMPIIGLGCWQADVPSEFEDAIEKALEAGYRHFDIAYAYGNEANLGNVLKRWIDAGKIKRQELFITSKLPTIAMHPSRVLQFAKISLGALKLDYLDLYLVHQPFGLEWRGDPKEITPRTPEGKVAIDPNTSLEQIWEAMETLVDTGLVRSIGISNFKPSQVERIVKAARIQPANHQVEMHAYFQQKELQALSKKHGITIVAYAPLGSPGRTLFFQKHSGVQFECPPILEDPLVVQLSKKYGKTTGQILLRHLIQLGVSPVPKSTNAERLRSNIQVFDFALNEEEMKLMEALDKGEQGRTFTMSRFKGVEEHPEYPYGPQN
jgi:diketogulonate reductase-like aldo/keto reductase